MWLLTTPGGVLPIKKKRAEFAGIPDDFLVLFILYLILMLVLLNA